MFCGKKLWGKKEGLELRDCVSSIIFLLCVCELENLRARSAGAPWGKWQWARTILKGDADCVVHTVSLCVRVLFRWRRVVFPFQDLH